MNKYYQILKYIIKMKAKPNLFFCYKIAKQITLREERREKLSHQSKNVVVGTGIANLIPIKKE